MSPNLHSFLWNAFLTMVLSLLAIGCTRSNNALTMNEQSHPDPIYKIKLLEKNECDVRLDTTTGFKNLNIVSERTTENIFETLKVNSKAFECFGGDQKERYVGAIHVEYNINPDGTVSNLVIGRNEILEKNMSTRITDAIREWKFARSTVQVPDLIKITFVFE